MIKVVKCASHVPIPPTDSTQRWLAMFIVFSVMCIIWKALKQNACIFKSIRCVNRQRGTLCRDK